MTKHDQETNELVKPVDAMEEVASFGAMIRSAREEAGYTIERVAMATRISAPFIEALEAEQLDRLPGAIFGRGFIRNLCKAYGEDSLAYLTAFDALYQKGPVKNPQQASRDEKRHQQLQKGVLLIQSNEWKNRLKTLAPHHYLRVKPLLGLLAVAVLGVIIFQVTQNEPESESPVVISQTEPVAAPEVTPVTPTPSETSVAQPVPPPVAAETAAPTPPALVGELEVELRVKSPVAVTFTKDQDKQVAETLQVQTYRYSFQQQFKLYVENAAALEIYFKGQRVGGANPKAEPRRFTFAAAEGEIAKKPGAPRL
jgi:cytoskeletal protein RodZ